MNQHFRPDTSGNAQLTDQRTLVAKVLRISDNGARGVRSAIQLVLALLAGAVIAWLASPASPLEHSAAVGIAAAVLLPTLCVVLMLRDNRRCCCPSG